MALYLLLLYTIAEGALPQHSGWNPHTKIMILSENEIGLKMTIFSCRTKSPQAALETTNFRLLLLLLHLCGSSQIFFTNKVTSDS